MYGEKNLAVSIEGNDATVVTDRKWCRFIIRQLLTNAIKYSPTGTSLTFRTNVTEQENVFLDLIDEGPGIQPHDLPRIFDKGFTGGNGRIHNASTGLGLYLAQTVAAKNWNYASSPFHPAARYDNADDFYRF
ncbi:ATP-binding protein [Paenibacillus rhizoplanae]